MITPCWSIIISFSSSVQVLGILRSQQVEEGDGGKLLVCVALAGPEVLYAERSTTCPVDTEVPLMIRAKTSKAVSGW